MATVVTVAVNHPHKGSDHTQQKAAGPRDGWSPATRGSDPETKGPVDAGAHAMARKSADTANIEGNESAKYEAMEKKSLKGLKGGGTEKELREGHNTRGKSMKPGGGGRFAKMVAGIEKSGKSESSAKAIAASAGRAKYGKSKFQAMAVAGRKRAGK